MRIYVGIISAALLAGVAVAEAAPNVAPSELPGRERERFRENPLDRFMQPNPAPVLRPTPPGCDRQKARRGKRAGRKPC